MEPTQANPSTSLGMSFGKAQDSFEGILSKVERVRGNGERSRTKGCGSLPARKDFAKQKLRVLSFRPRSIKLIHSRPENPGLQARDELRLLSINRDRSRLRPKGRNSRRLIYRVIDANINRAKEGLRVCEEIARFILESYNLTSEFKKIRHRTAAILKYLPREIKLFKERESLTDVGRKIYINELKRENCQDIFFANMQRAKESIRVLEEFTKLINKNTALKFKSLRYDIYGLEKKAAKRILSLCYRR